MKACIEAVQPMNTNINGVTTYAQVDSNHGFLFQALSGKNLYKYLIRAIVRELSCNALDAHVMAGTEDRAFDIHLPTTFEPYFAVRDYGIGLDDLGVRTTYLTLFGSTKRENIKQIGAWGLGSKSPLGYVDSFTVTAVKDGIERIYTIFKSEDGRPAITAICENKTDKHNGLEVRLAVASDSDIYTFKKEAEDVLQWFHVKPNFNVDVTYNTTSYCMQGLGGNINVYDHNCNKSSVVVHANIAYNLDAYLLGLSSSSKEYKLVQHGIELFMPNNTVEYSMSREELAYSESTIANIVAAISESVKDMPVKLAERFVGVPSFDAYCLLERMRRFNFVHDSQYEDLINAGVSPLHNMPDDHFSFEDQFKDLGVTCYRGKRGRKNSNLIEKTHLDVIKPNQLGNKVFYINDENRGSLNTFTKKLKHNFKDMNDRYFCVPSKSADAFVQLFKDRMDHTINVVSSLTMDAAPKAARVVSSLNRVMTYHSLEQFVTGRSRWNKSYYYRFDRTGQSHEPSGDNCYIVMDGRFSPEVDAEVARRLCSTWNISTYCVYGVHKDDVSKLDSSWTSFVDLVKSRVQVVIDQYNQHGMQADVSYRYVKFIDELAKYDDVSVLARASKPEAISESKVDDVKFACGYLKFGVEFMAEVNGIHAMIKAKENELANKYVLLAEAECITGGHFKDHMARYIEMVNQF